MAVSTSFRATDRSASIALQRRPFGSGNRHVDAVGAYQMANSRTKLALRPT